MNIPFVDLRSQYLSIKKDIDAAISSVIEETAFVGGKYVDDFQHQFQELYGVKYCIPVANGTDAIYIVLKMLGIGAGDEVITTASSWISTSETITQAGAKPVFVDIEPAYYTIDPGKIEAAITANTKAIIPVHLYGQAAEMDTIMAIAKKYKLAVIEDCAQAHFSEYKGKRTGTIGIAGTFSFYPGKNLGAYGDAGCIITNDDELARKCRLFSNHGSLKKHQHEIEGINSRLDAMQAAILSAKLPHIHQWTEQRIKNAALYDQLLLNSGLGLPVVRPESRHTYHLYVVRSRQRDLLQQKLNEQGVSTAIHYPTILPLLPAYSYLSHKPADFPVAYQYQQEILSLPMYPELTEEQINYVAEVIGGF
jgi:dTDP-4-amino-4,6-dideoxygalactose transaminase